MSNKACPAPQGAIAKMGRLTASPGISTLTKEGRADLKCRMEQTREKLAGTSFSDVAQAAAGAPGLLARVGEKGGSR